MKHGPGRTVDRSYREAWTLKGIRARCERMRDTITSAGLAQPAEVAAYWPGGAENPLRHKGGWIYCYGQMCRLLGRKDPWNLERRTALSDAEVLKALGDSPIPVKRLANLKDETTLPLLVYAKGLEAELYLDALDRQLAWMNAQRQRLLDAGTPAAMDLLTEVYTTISYTLQVCVWIVLDPGPELPFDPADPDPKIPHEIQVLEPWDMLRICEARQRQLARLSALRAITDEKTQHDGGSRPGWSMFIGSLALEMGETPATLMRHRSLASLLASVRLSNAARTPKRDVPKAEVA